MEEKITKGKKFYSRNIAALKGMESALIPIDYKDYDSYMTCLICQKENGEIEESYFFTRDINIKSFGLKPLTKTIYILSIKKCVPNKWDLIDVIIMERDNIEEIEEYIEKHKGEEQFYISTKEISIK